MTRPLEKLSHRQREITPPRFAEWLVAQVRARTGAYVVAALWLRSDSPYFSIAGVECYSLARNAYLYDGPHPIIAHPPCGPWGKYSAVSRQDKNAGQVAMLMVALYGGVVEQPVGSQLFVSHDVVNQSEWGHLALKPTKLYWADRPRL